MATEVPESLKAAMDRIQRDRGWIVNSYAQLEYLIRDLLIRARDLPAYASALDTVPFDPGKRLRKFKQIVAMDGPLAAYRERIDRLIVRPLEIDQERRHYLVHGLVTLVHTGGKNPGIEVRRFVRDEQDPFKEGRIILSEVELRAIMEDVTATADAGLRLILEIHRRFGWIKSGPLGD